MKKSLLVLLLVHITLGTKLVAQDLTVNAFIDRNGSGIKEVGEPVAVGITVELHDGVTNAQLLSGMTNAAGEVVFPSVNVADYYVQFVIGASQTATIKYANGATIPQGDSDDSDADQSTLKTDIFTMPASDLDGISIGVFTPVEINGEVWLDLNGDGIDAGDGPAPVNIVVTLQDLAGYAITTQADGSALANPVNTTTTYTFTNLSPGDYNVNFSEPSGSYITRFNADGNDTQLGDSTYDSDADVFSGDSRNITLLSGAAPYDKMDAGYYDGITIKDFVWEDLNGDGDQDAGEPGLDGIQVELLNSIGGAALDPNGNTIPPVNTAGGGFYEFTEVPPGIYKVKFEVQPTSSSGNILYFTIKNVGGATTPDGNGTDSDPNILTGITDNTSILTLGTITSNVDAGYTSSNGSQGSGNVPILFVTPIGVGIEVPYPSEKLEVLGNSKLTGKLMVSDSTSFKGCFEVTGYTKLLDSVYIDKAIKQDTQIISTLQNGWVNYEQGFAHAKFYRDKEDRVHISGLIKNGSATSNTLLFILPNGYRPSSGRLIFNVANDGNTARIDILPNGEVLLISANNNTFLNLTGISFRAD